MKKTRMFLVKAPALILAALTTMGEVKSAETPQSPPAVSNQGTYDPHGNSEMVHLADQKELADFVGTLTTDWTAFVEDRAHPIRRAAGLPKRWLANTTTHTRAFKGVACPGEFYVFQIGVFAAKRPVSEIGITFGHLTGASGAIGRERLRCFNLGGVDPHGVPFTNRVSVPAGHVQALWIGVDVPTEATGVYQGLLKVKEVASGTELEVALELTVAGAVLPDHGDRDSWRLSRLRWLDSTIGLDDDMVIEPFRPIRRAGNTLKLLGRELELAPDGLPAQARSFFNPYFFS